MAEIKNVKTEKTTVNAGERIKISFEFWYEQDFPYDYPHDYPISSERFPYDYPHDYPISSERK